MARIGGINVRDNSHAVIALTDIYGIGPTTARDLCEKAGVSPSTKIRECTEAELEKLRAEVKRIEDDIEGNLRRKRSMDIKRLKDIKAYRGRRHMASLPCRGQRTKTNARTRKGPTKPIRK